MSQPTYNHPINGLSKKFECPFDGCFHTFDIKAVSDFVDENVKLNTYYKPHYFDGQNPHWSKDWQSDGNRDRISLVFYTRGKKQDGEDSSEDGEDNSEGKSKPSFQTYKGHN